MSAGRDAPAPEPADASGAEAIGPVLDSFLARLRRRERPALTEYIEHHPELAEEIRDLFTFRGTMAAINTALDGLVYTPDKGYVGSESLTITTNDLNSGFGVPLVDSDSVSILVEAKKKGK